MITLKTMSPQERNRLWCEILESIKVSVSVPVFNTWFSQTHLVNLQKHNNHFVAEVGCNSIFVRNTIENRYLNLLQDQLNSSLGGKCDIVFVIKENPYEKKQKVVAPLFEPPDKNQRIIEIARSAGLRPGFTFENFAVSSSNQMAHAAGEAVAKELGTAYNPLFIWGGVGVGKTHLMHAIGFSVIKRNPDTKILCCTGEQFTNDIVEGIRNKSTALVRQKYRKLKALLVDDIQFIAGKDTVQEEFFHTFNTLVLSGSQVILTSDKPPYEISRLEERLRSRFEAGLIVDIAPPDFELRCAIVQIKARERGIDIPMDLVQMIAANLETARKIEGFLVLLSSESKAKNIPISPELIESLIKRGAPVNGQTIKATPNDFISAVSKYFSLGKRALLGNSRARPVARPRQILMYLLRTELGLPLDQVGQIVGGRDHTTVIHAVDKISHLVSTDTQIRKDVSGIKGLL